MVAQPCCGIQKNKNNLQQGGIRSTLQAKAKFSKSGVVRTRNMQA